MRATRWWFTVLCSAADRLRAAVAEQRRRPPEARSAPTARTTTATGWSTSPTTSAATARTTRPRTASPCAAVQRRSRQRRRRQDRLPERPGLLRAAARRRDDDCPTAPAARSARTARTTTATATTDFPNDSGLRSRPPITTSTRTTRSRAAHGLMIKKLPFDGVDAWACSRWAAPRRSCRRAAVAPARRGRVRAPPHGAEGRRRDDRHARHDGRHRPLHPRRRTARTPTAELACNDDIGHDNTKSTLTKSIARRAPTTSSSGARHERQRRATSSRSKQFIGEGTTCTGPATAAPVSCCRIPHGRPRWCARSTSATTRRRRRRRQERLPERSGLRDAATDDDETDSCPGVGPNCPECGDGIDNDGDTKIDYSDATRPARPRATRASRARPPRASSR